jgi:hypothetical protein
MLAMNASPQELAIWKHKLDALKSDCGCRVGTLVLLPSMALYSYFCLYAHPESYTLRYKVVSGFIVFFASAAIGKLLGILLARCRYRLLQKKYLAHTTPTNPHHEPPA